MPEVEIRRADRSFPAPSEVRMGKISTLAQAVLFARDPSAARAVLEVGVPCRFDSPVYVGRYEGRLFASNCVLAYLATRLPDISIHSRDVENVVRPIVHVDDLLSVEITILQELERAFDVPLLDALAEASLDIAREKQRRLALLRCLLTHQQTLDGSSHAEREIAIDCATRKIRNLTDAWI